MRHEWTAGQWERGVRSRAPIRTAFLFVPNPRFLGGWREVSLVSLMSWRLCKSSRVRVWRAIPIERGSSAPAGSRPSTDDADLMQMSRRMQMIWPTTTPFDGRPPRCPPMRRRSSFDADRFLLPFSLDSILLGVAEFYRVLPALIDSHCFLFGGFYPVLLGFTGFYWVLLGFTGFYWVLLGFTGFL